MARQRIPAKITVVGRLISSSNEETLKKLKTTFITVIHNKNNYNVEQIIETPLKS